MSFLPTKPVLLKGRKKKSVPKAETDVNKIVARFQKTGQLPPATQPGQFMDCSGLGDCRENLERVKILQEQLRREYAKIEEEKKRHAEKADVSKGVPGDREPVQRDRRYPDGDRHVDAGTGGGGDRDRNRPGDPGGEDGRKSDK